MGDTPDKIKIVRKLHQVNPPNSSNSSQPFQNTKPMTDGGPTQTRPPQPPKRNRPKKISYRPETRRSWEFPDFIGWALLAAVVCSFATFIWVYRSKSNNAEVSYFAAARPRYSIDEANDLLFKGVRNNNLQQVREAFENGADANLEYSVVNKEGDTIILPAFFMACNKGQDQIVQAFIEHGVKINSKKYGLTPIMAAADRNQIRTIRLLIAKGARLDASTYRGSALSLAAGAGNLEMVKTLVESGADLESRVDDNHNTPLMAAAKNGRLIVLQYLFAKGAKLDAERDDSNALVLAIENGHRQTAGFILRNTPSVRGVKALVAAASIGDVRLAKELVAKEASLSAWSDTTTPLMAAASKGNIEMLNYLLDASLFSHINAKDEDGETALIRAVRAGKLEVVRILIKKGADLDVKDKTGKSAIAYAELRQDKTIHRLLLDSAAKY